MDYRPIIESRYNRENWQLLLHDIFGNKIKFWHTPSVVGTSSQFAKQALWLGTITLSDERTISVYEVELADSVDIERNRRGIRDMLLTAWRNNGNAGAFMFCYRKNESVLRFSYVSEAWAFAEDGTYQKESTDTKRFTYLLGEGHRSRTAIQQFEKLRDSKLSLRDLTKAFSVDAVSDMFFDGYKKQYEDIIQYITGKRMVKVANKWEEQIKNEPCEEIMQEFARFPNPEKAVRDYVKKLMGRLVFLQFLQKKGWLGVPAGEPWGTGDREFIQNLFANCQDKDHFIDNVLEVLFNDLNTERKGDLATPSLGGGRGRLIPYLNGGLFERDATDETAFPLPAKYMQSLLDFFASYNFTIDENDPDDAEVGVDPEMLGRIFENLLEDNKDKGTFYTPKEIVSYMCRESLIAYLQTDIEDEATKEAIRQFVTTHDVNALGTNDKFRQQVDEALKNVKICDPAIGSGAFPMGLLKELFQCRTALEDIDQSKAAEIKKHIIQQNIYGVDIERGAVDIARLRFWLSLIVDEETPQALPNLDFKIMQGNSLLEQYKGVDLSNITELKQDKVGAYQTTMFDDMLDVLRLNLRKKLDEYYNCTDHKRKAILKQDIINNVKQQLKEQSINVDFGDLDLSGNNQFMLWHTWFYDVFSQGGFDIVIGNPPYVTYKGKQKVEVDDDVLKQMIANYKSAEYKINSYALFVEHAINILKMKGVQAYIIPSTILQNEYLKNVRKLLVAENHLVNIVSFGNRVFDAVTDSIICVCRKGKYPSLMRFMRVNDLSFKTESSCDYNPDMWDDSEKNYVIDTRTTKQDASIFEKMERGNNTLGDLYVVYVGIVANGIKKFLHHSPINNRCKKYLQGKHIDHFQIKFKSIYIEFVKSLLHSNTDESVYELERKILVRKTGNILIATIDEEQYYTDQSIYNVYLRRSSSYNDYVTTAILNSTLMNYYFNRKLITNADVFPYIKGIHLKSFPLPSLAKKSEVVSRTEKKVREVIAIKRTSFSADTSSLESEIDQLVYKLYGLTEEEIALVESQ
jgi:type I restriction-modification system DNA methylase subunit